MTKLLKDKNDYFFVNIIGFIGKNKIFAVISINIIIINIHYTEICF